MGEQRRIGDRGSNPNTDRRRYAEALLSFANETIVLNAAQVARARQIEKLGFGPFDALHLACAEQAAADVFITTDDDLWRRARQCTDQLHIWVENPVSWYTDTHNDLHRKND